MAEPSDKSNPDIEKSIEAYRQQLQVESDTDLVALAEKVFQLWWRWADFHLFIISPTFDTIEPPHVILPETMLGSHELEFVYPIHDHGYKLSTSKGEDMYKAGLSMCKLYFTIEKMVHILIERIKSGGVTTETEVQVAFDGHELAQRKCFESIINLPYNVVVTNFDPGSWGERYLQIAKRLAEKGYGYPAESPRDFYRHPFNTAPRAKR